MAKKKKLQVLPSKDEFSSPLSPTGKDRPPLPSIVIPPTPAPSSGPSSQDHTNSPGDGIWTITPAPSPRPQQLPLPSMAGTGQEQDGDLRLDAATIASPEILALANFQISIKQALANLSKTVDRLEVQSTRMQQLGADIKIHEQIALLRAEVELQINRQKVDLDLVQQALAVKVKVALTEHIKMKMRVTARETILSMVQDKIREELTTQIPEKLREGLFAHQRQIQEVKASTHNSEARRYNASLQLASPDVPLRPLLRPLPTPEQSPMPVHTTTSSSSRLNSAHPLSAYPHAPAPTPIKRSASAFAATPMSRSHSLQPIDPTPSSLFPKDLKSLFALGPDATKALLKEYGLESAAPSPVVEKATELKAPKLQQRVPSSKAAVPQPTIPEESDTEDEKEMEAHVQDMNTFMAHIGVPFLMVPPPKRKETNAERRKKLAPLIINASPWPIR